MRPTQLSKATVVVCVFLIVFLGMGVALGGDNWPTWRGPDMNGIASGGNPPLRWGESENIKWKVKLTGDESNSSPVIWGDKIFFQTAVDTKIKDDTPTPVVGFGMVYCTSGFRGSALQAIKLSKTGDLTNTDAIVWQVNEDTPYVPSPLLYDGRIYVCRVNQEIISCYDAKTGKPHFVKQKMDEIKEIYASPTAAGGRIYFVGRNGVSYVLKPSDQYEVLTVNTLNDKFDCSPAFVGDEMYLKGKQNLYCIAASS